MNCGNESSGGPYAEALVGRLTVVSYRRDIRGSTGLTEVSECF